MGTKINTNTRLVHLWAGTGPKLAERVNEWLQEQAERDVEATIVDGPHFVPGADNRVNVFMFVQDIEPARSAYDDHDPVVI